MRLDIELRVLELAGLFASAVEGGDEDGQLDGEDGEYKEGQRGGGRGCGWVLLLLL